MTPVTRYDAVVLAGGRGTRLGGVDKPALRLRGRSLLERAIDAVAAARRIAVVTHSPLAVDDPRVVPAAEEPRWSGPVVALATGLAACGDDAAPLTVVLAADLIEPAVAVRALLARLDGVVRDEWIDGVVAVDPGGSRQPLLAAYRTRPLLDAVGAVSAPDPASGARGPSMRAVLDRLRLHDVPLPWHACADVDTPADAMRHGIAIPGAEADRDLVA